MEWSNVHEGHAPALMQALKCLFCSVPEQVVIQLEGE